MWRAVFFLALSRLARCQTPSQCTADLDDMVIHRNESCVAMNGICTNNSHCSHLRAYFREDMCSGSFSSGDQCGCCYHMPSPAPTPAPTPSPTPAPTPAPTPTPTTSPTVNTAGMDCTPGSSTCGRLECVCAARRLRNLLFGHFVGVCTCQ